MFICCQNVNNKAYGLISKVYNALLFKGELITLQIMHHYKIVI